jgi:pyridoxal phosphate enzyme (YggS family)
MNVSIWITPGGIVMRITKNLEDLKERISRACALAGRNENEVSILAVSKRHSIEAIREAQAAGLNSMGENYLQEALHKIHECPPETVWHFIGQIQSNKTRAIAENFDWVQTVASQKTAERLARQRPESLEPLNVCVQVDIDGNNAHGGISIAATEELCSIVKQLPALRLRGLMTIPVPATEIAEQRKSFALIRNLFEELQAKGYQLDTLSMGMTGDLEAAILEGSTMIRIGTALFGTRPDAAGIR